MEFDPSMELALRVTRGVTATLQPIQTLFNEVKKRREQLPITKFLYTTSPAQQPGTCPTLETSLPSTSTALDPVDPIDPVGPVDSIPLPSSGDIAATEKHPTSPPVGLTPPGHFDTVAHSESATDLLAWKKWNEVYQMPTIPWSSEGPK